MEELVAGLFQFYAYSSLQKYKKLLYLAQVLGGTVNRGSGILIYRCTQKSEDSAVARMASIVEQVIAFLDSSISELPQAIANFLYAVVAKRL